MPRALIITDQDVQQEEFSYPISRLLEDNWDIDLWLTGSLTATDKVGTELLTYFNKCVPNGHVATWDYLISTIFDVIIIPGGFSPEKVRLNTNVLSLIQSYINGNTVIGAICHGPQVLMSIPDFCKDRKMTCFIGVKDDLINAGAIYENAPVVVDGNLITSPHYKYNHLFVKAILDKYKQNLEAEYAIH